MEQIPIPAVGDEYDGNPIIQLAVDAIRGYGRESIGRAEAAALLPFWESFTELSAREVEAILRRFPQSEAETRDIDSDTWPDGTFKPEGGVATRCPRCQARGTATQLQLGTRDGVLRLALCWRCQDEVVAQTGTEDAAEWVTPERTDGGWISGSMGATP